MTLRQFLNTLDHEVFVRVRPHDLMRDKTDIVMWSADWIGGSGYPDEVEKYLECEANDLSVELHPDPENPDGAFVPMLVVYAYTFAKPEPAEVFVLERISDYGTGEKYYDCRVFLDEKCAMAAMRDSYNSEIDAFEKTPDYSKSVLLDDSAKLVFPGSMEINWKVNVRETEDNDYR